MSKIVIVGCSWGCGEWINDKQNTLAISHPGITEYLSADHTVVNLSRAGASNWQSVFSLRNYLEYRVDPAEPTTIFVLQTDASRPAVSEKYDVDYDSILNKAHGLEDYYRTLLEIFYIKLHDLAQQYNTKIHMIGGLTDLDLDSMSLYNNLQTCCVSWIQLLNATHPLCYMPLVLDPRLLEKAKAHGKLDMVEDIINHSDTNFLQAQQLMETEYFGPAYGDFHPSRKGHQVLANHITNYLKDLA